MEPNETITLLCVRSACITLVIITIAALAWTYIKARLQEDE